MKQESHRAYGTAVTRIAFLLNSMSVVDKDWKIMQNGQNYALQIILGHFCGKRWGKVQNNQNWAFMIISDHFKPLWWEKIEEKNGKAKLRHSELFWNSLVGKDWKSVKKF